MAIRCQKCHGAGYISAKCTHGCERGRINTCHSAIEDTNCPKCKGTKQIPCPRLYHHNGRYCKLCGDRDYVICQHPGCDFWGKVKKRVEYKKKSDCSFCFGTGWEKIKCDCCQGTGLIEEERFVFIFNPSTGLNVTVSPKDQTDPKVNLWKFYRHENQIWRIKPIENTRNRVKIISVQNGKALAFTKKDDGRYTIALQPDGMSGESEWLLEMQSDNSYLIKSATLGLYLFPDGSYRGPGIPLAVTPNSEAFSVRFELRKATK